VIIRRKWQQTRLDSVGSMLSVNPSRDLVKSSIEVVLMTLDKHRSNAIAGVDDRRQMALMFG